MTLILGMSRPEGVYLSVDYRIVNSRTQRVEDDAVAKHLRVQYPPVPGGPNALLAYTGLAILPDGTPTGVWIRETLRGESETFDASMRRLQSRLDRDIGPLGHDLIINCLVVHGDKRYFGGLSNMKRGPKGRIVRSGNFGYGMNELTEHHTFVNGSGADNRPVTEKQLLWLHSQAGVIPNRPTDYMNMLAIANRTIAAKVKTVSPHCHVGFINSVTYQFGPTGRIYTEPGESVPFVTPSLFCGADLTGFMERAMRRFQERLAGRPSPPEPDIDSLDEELKRRP